MILHKVESYIYLLFQIYKPSLWYYEKLLFLDPYVTPRKSRNSMENEEKKTDLPCEVIILSRTLRLKLVFLLSFS
jgi:hypothetical protein